MQTLRTRLKQLVTLTGSYVLRRPASTLAGVPRVLAPAMLPGALAWSAILAANGAVAAARIGIRVRRAPILRPSKAIFVEPRDLAPVCTLISDTHLVAPGRSPCELEEAPLQWPHRALPTHDSLVSALRRVLRHVSKHAPATVLWCGDQVDTGEDAEWAAWTEVVDSIGGLSHRLLPGNHDICFNRPFDHDFALTRRKLRERAFADHALAEFPLFDTIVSERGPVTTVLLDSCRHPSTHVLSNAVGEFGSAALAELARGLARARGPLLVATHHHVWRDKHFLRPETWFETAIDADELVAILSRYRRRAAHNHVLVVHGHRHILGAGRVGEPGDEIEIVALPSTTLGDKPHGVLDATLRYAIAGLRANGTWGVAIREVGAH